MTAKSLLGLEDHLYQLERHSTRQVKQLQEEQRVLEHASDYAGGSSNASKGEDLAALGDRLLDMHSDVKAMQQDMYELQKEHDSFVKVRGGTRPSSVSGI